jgi:uncharacterized protein
MTTLNLDENNAAYQIRAYQPGLIQINDATFTNSIILSPTQLIEYWQPQSATELSADSFTLILDMKPDVLLIGTGSQLVFLPVDLYGELINQGIGVELMDTRAACRTFSALSAENRNVVAALIIK